MRYNEIRILLENDEEHQKALDNTGFWGKAGAGCIFIALDTGRLLLPLRSAEVEQPLTWGTWGGAIDQGESPEKAVRREVSEEAGYHGHYEIEPLFVFKSGSFRYFNYLAIVDDEFTPHLDWETEEADWFPLDNLPSPLHFGLASVLKDPASLNKIKKYAKIT
jgi:8-oxo-dGTP pyrophosphatase MutT (NUDIX family)